MPSSAFEIDDDGKWGEGLKLVGAIAGALWFPILVYVAMVLIVLSQCRDSDQVISMFTPLKKIDRMHDAPCSSCGSCAKTSVPVGTNMPKYPTPWDVENNNHHTVKQQEYHWPRPAVVFSSA